MKKSYFISRSTRGISAVIFFWLYIPHILVYLFSKNNTLINSDLDKYKQKTNGKLPNILALVFLLHNNIWYRTTFYYRIGPIWTWIISWYRPGAESFMIPDHVVIGPGLHVEHSWATVLNAMSIGKNFSCLQGVTIGKKGGKRPTIGDNVSVFANAIIIGDVHVGNNVTIGAGAVVVKDIPDNAIVVGNPARIIKYNIV